MADNDHAEPLANSHIPNSESISIPFLFLVATRSVMCISGLGYAAIIFKTYSFLSAIIFVIVISATCWLNSKIILKASHEKLILNPTEPYSYSNLISRLWGSKRELSVQLSMAFHNIIMLSFLQKKIAITAIRVFQPDTIENNKVIPSQPIDIDTVYYIALADIPLILLALQNKYERFKYFAIIATILWVQGYFD